MTKHVTPCPHDTDGDGDCHLCSQRGVCHLRAELDAVDAKLGPNDSFGFNDDLGLWELRIHDGTPDGIIVNCPDTQTAEAALDFANNGYAIDWEGVRAIGRCGRSPRRSSSDTRSETPRP